MTVSAGVTIARTLVASVTALRVAKVRAPAADNPAMASDKHLPLKRGTSRYDEAIALENSVRIIRKARGKHNPEDFAEGTPEWHAVIESFLIDLLWASGNGLHDNDD
ncbi:hypothetical protein [Paraburkholderia rhizosphaerae]|uniref:Uncharacterized protein n=1 Tax=Paraburkholderia rhizosphaerae TaxID=480658 RepID=A0A4R8L379_9BURK|nr:hypothetical protein [Paraburkholderia rhizosphaerae]TDY36996.1 hypothetical protein BX592_14920 [Paraburkholderia rhizosphaerae]